MNRSIKLFAAFVFSAAALLAQGPGMDGPPPGGPGGPDGPLDSPSPTQRNLREPNAHRLLGQLTKELKLSEEQKEKIKPILEERQREIEALIKSSGSGSELIPKSRRIDQQSWADARALLTEPQQTKFDSFTKKLEEKRKRNLRRADSDEGGPPPDGPPPGPQSFLK